MNPWFDNRNNQKKINRNIRRKSLAGALFLGFLRNLKVTTWLIAINILFFFLTLFLGNFINYLALQPKALFENYYAWTLLTSMFMHAGLAHLFFNMFSLYFIGNLVETIIGRKRFLYFYLISGLAAGLFFAALAYFFGYGIGMKIFGSPDIIALGASGAIFGLLGLLAMITPRKKVYLIAGPLVAILIQALVSSIIELSSVLMLLNIIVTIYFLASIFAIFSSSSQTRKLALPLELEFWLLPFIAIIPLIVIGLFVELPIGNMAHLGGLIAGLVYGAYLRKKYSRKIVLLNRYLR